MREREREQGRVVWGLAAMGGGVFFVCFVLRGCWLLGEREGVYSFSTTSSRKKATSQPFSLQNRPTSLPHLCICCNKQQQCIKLLQLCPCTHTSHTHTRAKGSSLSVHRSSPCICAPNLVFSHFPPFLPLSPPSHSKKNPPLTKPPPPTKNKPDRETDDRTTPPKQKPTHTRTVIRRQAVD